MFANSSEMLAHISSIIRSHPSIEKHLEAELSMMENALRSAGSPAHHNHLQYFNQPEFKKLVQRIEKLEENNDQLLCIIQFLFEKISHLGEEQIQADSASIPELKNTGDCKCKPELTKREMDVFHLLEKGLCAKEIAQVLFISETTVITHKKNLKEKFNARNTVELISKVLGK